MEGILIMSLSLLFRTLPILKLHATIFYNVITGLLG